MLVSNYSSTRRTAKTLVVVVALLIAVALGGAMGYFARPMLNSAPAASHGSTTAPPDAISALGRIQPLGGVIPVYGPPGERIGKLYDVSVGTVLKPGDPIADLAGKTEHAREVTIAELQLTEAKQQLAQARAGGEAKIATAQLEADQLTADEEQDKKSIDLQIDVLELQRKLAVSQVDRVRKLMTEGVRISDEEREQADLLLAKAKAEADAARLKKEKLIGGYDRGRKLAAAKLVAARAELNEAIARVPIQSTTEKVALAKQTLELATIKAPVGGTVLKVASRTGEPTGAQQPILYLADTTKMVVVAEVYESDAPRLRAGLAKGQSYSVSIGSPAFASDVKLKGTIRNESQLSRMIARNSVFALSPREDTDRRVIEATVELDDGSSKLAANYAGLQVNVELAILASGGR